MAGIKKLNIANLILRYLLVLILPVSSLWIFYAVFTPLTLWPVATILKLFYFVKVNNVMLTVNGIQIELINACIAGAAYYLLVLLNLSTKGISALKRLKIFLFSAGIFLLFNIIRIVMLTMVFLNYPGAFDFTHAFFWYGISTIAVVLIWIFSVKFFEIKNIPLFSDIKAISVFLKRKPGK